MDIRKMHTQQHFIGESEKRLLLVDGYYNLEPVLKPLEVTRYLITFKQENNFESFKSFK